MAATAFLVLTYLLAAFPFGLLVALVGCGIDPRLAGSRNTGATNVSRLCGTRLGVLTLLLDLAKGLVPVLCARAMTDSPVFLSMVAVAAVVPQSIRQEVGGMAGPVAGGARRRRCRRRWGGRRFRLPLGLPRPF